MNQLLGTICMFIVLSDLYVFNIAVLVAEIPKA